MLGSSSNGKQVLGSVSQVLSIAATIISCSAFGLSILIWTESRTHDRRDLFLKMHERLIDSDLRLGRQILTDYVTSVEAAGTLRRDRPNNYQVAGRTLAMLDILGLYAERKYVDSQLV